MRLVLSILVGITILGTICQSYLALGISPRVFANEVDTEEVVKLGKEKKPSTDPAVCKLREAAEKALWEKNDLPSAGEMIREDWDFFLEDKTELGRENYRKSAVMLGNLCIDSSAFPQALDCFQTALKQDEYFHPNSSQVAIDLNNVGLCYSLVATTTKATDKKAEQFSLALSTLRDAEQRLRKLKDDDALQECLTNQYIVLNDVHDKTTAQNVFAQITQNDKSRHSAFKRLFLEQQ